MTLEINVGDTSVSYISLKVCTDNSTIKVKFLHELFMSSITYVTPHFSNAAKRHICRLYYDDQFAEVYAGDHGIEKMGMPLKNK